MGRVVVWLPGRAIGCSGAVRSAARGLALRLSSGAWRSMAGSLLPLHASRSQPFGKRAIVLALIGRMRIIRASRRERVLPTALESPRRFGTWLRLLVLTGGEPLHKRRRKIQQAGDKLKDRRYQGQNGHGFHLPPRAPKSGTGWKGVWCHAASGLRVSMVHGSSSTQMACVHRKVAWIVRASNAIAPRLRQRSLTGSTRNARDCCDGRVCAGAWRQKPRIVSGSELLPLRLRADMRRRGMERVRKGGGAACLAMASATLPAAKRRLRCCRRRGAVCADAFATRFSAQMFHVKHLFLYRTTLRQCVSRETYAGEAVRQGFVDRSGDCLAAARPRFDCRGRRRSFRPLFPWRAVRSCAARERKRALGERMRDLAIRLRTP